MATPRAHPSSDRPIGARERSEVERALDAAETAAAGQRQTAYDRGVDHAYHWVLGRLSHGPVTGAPTDAVPDMQQLTAENDAASVQLEDRTLPDVTREYMQGVHWVLSWVCGYRDDWR